MGGACVKYGVQIRTDNHSQEREQSDEPKDSFQEDKVPQRQLQKPSAEARTVYADIQKIRSLKMQRRKSTR